MTTIEQAAPGFRALSAKQVKSIAMASQFVVSLWVGAVSGGKTIASLFAFLLAIPAAPEGYPIVIVGRTIDTIERNVIEPLQNEAIFGSLARLTVHTKGAKTAVIMGRLVQLVGAPNKLAEGRIRGSSIGLAYVDEAVLVPREFWDMLITRLRAPGSRMLATTNPDSRNHWLHKHYIRRAADHGMVVFHFTMHDNPLYFPGGEVGPEYIARMERAFAGVFYQRMILGLWTTAQGAIFDMWNPAVHVVRWDDMPPIDRILGVGADFGTANATSSIMLGITAERLPDGSPAPRLILLDEWRHDPKLEDPETGATAGRLAPSEQASHVRAWLRSQNHVPKRNRGYGAMVRPGTFYVDPAAADFREELRKGGTRADKADNDHAGISEMMSLMAGARPRLLVTDRCRGFIDEVTEYVWDAKKSDEQNIDEPVKVNDHSIDAARYAIRSTRPVWLTMFQRAYGLAA